MVPRQPGVNGTAREAAGVAGRVAPVFGVSRQDGAYLSRFLVSKRYPVHGTTRQPTGARLANVDSLGIGNWVAIHAMNPRDADTVNALVCAVRPHEVFNLTGPSSVSYSFAMTEEVQACITACTTNIVDTRTAVCGEAPPVVRRRAPTAGRLHWSASAAHVSASRAKVSGSSAS